MGDVIRLNFRHAGVGEECTRCLGTGTPEHFSLDQPEGPATCSTCQGTGRVSAKIQYLSREPVPVSTKRRK